MIEIALQVLWIIQILLFGYFILSWFPLQSGGVMHQLWTVLDKIFGPILHKLRSKLPRTRFVDLASIVLIVGIRILQVVLMKYRQG